MSDLIDKKCTVCSCISSPKRLFLTAENWWKPTGLRVCFVKWKSKRATRWKFTLVRSRFAERVIIADATENIKSLRPTKSIKRPRRSSCERFTAAKRPRNYAFNGSGNGYPGCGESTREPEPELERFLECKLRGPATMYPHRPSKIKSREKRKHTRTQQENNMEFRSRAVSPRRDPVFADLINCETTNRLRLFSLRGKTARSEFLRALLRPKVPLLHRPPATLTTSPLTFSPLGSLSASLFADLLSRSANQRYIFPRHRSSFEIQRGERSTRVESWGGRGGEIFVQDEGEIRGDEVR